MILKVGFLVGASLAAFAAAQISSNSRGNRKSSTNVSESCDSRFQERKFEEEGNEKKAKAMIQAEHREGYEEFELEFLSSVVEEMECRGISQEKELLELYNLKQQQICFAQLQKQLKDRIMKIDMLKARINALASERMKLHEDINKNQIAKNELEIAKERIKEIQATGNKDDGEMKKRIKILKDHLSGFNKKAISIEEDNNIVENKLQATKDVELEVAGKKRKNRELQLETRELAIKLVAAEARVDALSKMTEEKVKACVEKDISILKHANEDCLERVERLQKNRFDMVEELVYQRWLNACLRFEVQDYHTPQETKQKHDLMKKRLSFDSQVRSKRASLDSSSSSTSSIDSDEASCTTTDTTPSNSSNQKIASKKFSFIHNVKRWGKGFRGSRSKVEDISDNIEYSVSRGVTRRFSMSDVPPNPPILRNIKQDYKKLPEMQTLSRVKRVSFSDSVKPEVPASSDAPKLGALGASEDVTEASWDVESERIKLEILASIADVVEVNDLGELKEEDTGDDNGESQMVNNGARQTTEDQYSGMVLEELGKAKSYIEDQNLHTLHVLIFIFLILILLFIVTML